MHRAMTRLDEPSLIENNEVVGHARSSFGAAEIHPRDARKTDHRHWSRRQHELSQFRHADFLEGRTGLERNVNRRAMASRRTATSTLIVGTAAL